MRTGPGDILCIQGTFKEPLKTELIVLVFGTLWYRSDPISTGNQRMVSHGQPMSAFALPSNDTGFLLHLPCCETLRNLCLAASWEKCPSSPYLKHLSFGRSAALATLPPSPHKRSAEAQYSLWPYPQPFPSSQVRSSGSRGERKVGEKP